MAKQQKLSIKMPESVLPGVYANQMLVSHTREEFVIDFVNLFPPEGVAPAADISSCVRARRRSSRNAIACSNEDTSLFSRLP